MSVTEREVKEQETAVEVGVKSETKKAKRFSREPSARWLIVILCIVAISAAASLYIYKGGLSSSHVHLPASLPAFPKTSGHRLLTTATKSKPVGTSSGSKTTTSAPTPTSNKNPFTPIVNTSNSPGTSSAG